MKHTFKSLVYALTLLLIAVSAAHAGYEEVSFHPYTIDREHKMALKYDIYAGGFKALNASLVMDLDKKAYDMALEAETEGFIGSMFPWKGSYNTSGHADNGVLIPTIYTQRSTWKKNLKITEMNYGPDGKVLKTTTHEGTKTTTNRDIDDMLAAHAVDLLTGTLVILQTAQNNNKCAGKFPVFDGKRRYNITLSDDGVEVLPPSKYSRFEGKAMRCTLKVEPVAGFKKKDKERGWMAVQNHTETRNKLPTLWLARLKDSDQIVPVRMEIASAYGTVVAHLANGVDQ